MSRPVAVHASVKAVSRPASPAPPAPPTQSAPPAPPRSLVAEETRSEGRQHRAVAATPERLHGEKSHRTIAARPSGALLDLVLWVGALLGLLVLVVVGIAQVTGIRPLVVQSGSMEPAIRTGSAALVQAVPASDLEPGDVATLQLPDGKRVTHRVVTVTPVPGAPAGFVEVVSKGDANDEPDEPVQTDEAHRLLAAVPTLGRVTAAVATPGGGFLMGSLFTAGLCAAGRSARRR